MQGRSWMAALALAAGLFPAPSSSVAESPRASNVRTAAGVADPTPPVTLVLMIAGLGSKGCDVDIKPGHPGCEFATVTEHVKDDGRLTLKLRDVRVKNADRDCTFAITIREPGQAVRTMRRGLRISPSYEKDSSPSLTCYLSSPSRLAKAEAGASTTSKR